LITVVIVDCFEAIRLWDGKSWEAAVSIWLVSVLFFSEGLEISSGDP